MGFTACGLGTPGADAPRLAPRLEVDWEQPRCLLCNSSEGSILVEAPDPLPDGGGLWFAINQCQDCGLCFTCPRPSANAISQFYAGNYPPHGKVAKQARRRWLPVRLLRSLSLSARQGRHMNLERLPLLGQGRLLDFGCGGGAFLQRMHQRGWNVTGIDASEQVVQSVRSNLGLSVLVGSLPHAELGEAMFDVITMRHSLEHVHEPLEVLRAAYQLLAPGGQLIVSAPNIDSLPFKWFGRDWRGLDLPRHLTHFTPDTLQLMLSRAGFEVGPVRMVRQPQVVRRSAQLASRRRDARRWQRWLRYRLLAGAAAWYAYFARRCDAMIVTGIKSNAVQWGHVSAVTEDAPERPRFPADRWRDR